MLATNTAVAEDDLQVAPILMDSTPQVRVEYANVEDFLVDYTSNQTIGGMFIKPPKPMEIGTQFRLRIQLPGGRRTIDAEAEVRWTLPRDVAAPMTPGMGVRFGTLSSMDRGYIETLLANWA